MIHKIFTIRALPQSYCIQDILPKNQPYPYRTRIQPGVISNHGQGYPKVSNEFSHTLRTLSAAGDTILMANQDIFRAKEVGTRVSIRRESRLLVI